MKPIQPNNMDSSNLLAAKRAVLKEVAKHMVMPNTVFLGQHTRYGKREAMKLAKEYHYKKLNSKWVA